jgi:hypothetical protein
MPRLGVQVDSDHVDAACPRETQMEPEALHEPATLHIFELKVEFEPRAGGEVHSRTGQLIEASLNCGKL